MEGENNELRACGAQRDSRVAFIDCLVSAFSFFSFDHFDSGHCLVQLSIVALEYLLIFNLLIATTNVDISSFLGPGRLPLISEVFYPAFDRR